MPGALIPSVVLPTCLGCRVVELERDSVRAEAKMLRRRLEERNVAAMNNDVLGDVNGADQAPLCIPGS